MDNNQNSLTNSQWNQYQNTSSNFPTNSSNNLPFNGANTVWRQSHNINSANHHRPISTVNYPNSNLQISGASMNNPSQDNRSVQNPANRIIGNSENNIHDFRQFNLQQVRFPPNYGQNLRMPVQDTPNIRLHQTENSNSNYSACGISQSVNNGSHNPANFNASNIQVPFNYVHNQPPPVQNQPPLLNPVSNIVPLQCSTSYQNSNSSQASTVTNSLVHNQPPLNPAFNTVPLQCSTSYQNSISSQASTVTNSLVHQTFSPMNHFSMSYNVPPPSINNSSSVIFNQNQNIPPQPPLCITPCQTIESSLNYGLSLNTQIVPSVQFPNLPPTMVPPFGPAFPKVEESANMPASMPSGWEEEENLSKFLKNCVLRWNEKTRNRSISVTKFREVLKEALVTMKNLLICRENLVKLLKSDRDIWNAEVNQVFFFQHQLDNLCTLITMPENLEFIQRKLKYIKKKRVMKKRLKQNALNDKLKKLKKREEFHQEIDKWLDSIKEKNLKLKREAEMKKEADSILSEVRRKIHEAKRTIEKIKLFEKLRNARQAKAVNKGLFLPEHDEKFQNSISTLRETMLRQLSDYEAEEKALKVMLEAEQEGQLEEEALWKIKKLRSLQQKRQSNIIECLFGDTVEEPLKEDPIFLFYQFHNSGNKSIESLSQIRQHWDSHIHENGDPIPQQWVVPIPPSSSVWEVALKS